MIDYTLGDTLAILRLDAPPSNAITFALLDELRAALRRAVSDPQVQGIVITGGPGHFSAGADLAIFQKIRCGEDAVRASRVFQDAFQEIEDCSKPVVAVVAGHVLGGALELAMACHGRVAVQGSRFSMPEVRLGINPGAGGTQRLPRLVGLEAALEMLLSGRSIDTQRALELGLIDAVCPADELPAVSNASLARQPVGSALRTVIGEIPAKRSARRALRDVSPSAADRAALAKAEQQITAGRPEIIAPHEILNAVRTGIEESFQAGLRAEQEAFRACMATRATQNKIYVFCASRQTADVPGLEDEAPARISRAGVLGMGTMGTGIAQALLSAGISVVACDQSESALMAGVERIRASLHRRVGQGKLSAAQAETAMARLRPTSHPASLGAAELVVEAVFEDAAVKRAAFAQLESFCSADTIIATNTSTISLDVLAEGMWYPGRLIGMHFFHPAQQMPLVEVVRRPSTPPEVIAAALAVTKAMKKTPVVVLSREGFVVTRLFVSYLKEAFWLLEEGAEPEAVDRAMTDFGFAMGPLCLIDMSGLDILIFTEAILRRAFPQHGGLSRIAQQLVERGHLGQKTGAGVYRYEPFDRTPLPHEATAEIIAAARRESGVNRPPAAEQIVERLMLRMAAEAFCLIEEGVAQRPADIDVAMVLGTGLADFRGGVLRYACDVGLDRVLRELRQLSVECGPRYAPCRLLEDAAADPRMLTLAP